MPRSKQKKNGKSSKNRRKRRPNDTGSKIESMNFVPDAGPGCHIVRWDPQNPSSNAAFAWDFDIRPEDFDDQSVPDVAIDPDENTLTLCNLSPSATSAACLTVFDAPCYGLDGRPLAAGSATDENGVASPCVTFLALVPPRTFCTLCAVDADLATVRIESDVRPWRRHPAPQAALGFPVRGFPLDDGDGPFLCTQGAGGHLTHHFVGNLHAVDFRCEVNTPLTAVEDGEVVEVKDDCKATGIGVANLYKWNSILLRHRREGDGEEEVFFSEYVHIRAASVKKGDRVGRGERIGYSGDVGFSPEPHLHFTIYRSGEAEAPSLSFQFEGRDGRAYQPKAGIFYDSSGPVSSQDGGALL